MPTYTASTGIAFVTGLALRSPVPRIGAIPAVTHHGAPAPAAFHELGLAAQVPIITAPATVIIAGMGFLLAVLTYLVTRRSSRTAEQKLFADLLPQRNAWKDGFEKAVEKRNKEVQSAILNQDHPWVMPIDSSRPDEKSAKELLEAHLTTANTLFDHTITGPINEIIREIEKQERLMRRIGMAVAAKKAYEGEDIDRTLVARLAGDVIRSLKPFLYVGHIKQNIKEARPTPKITGMFDTGVKRWMRLPPND